MKIQYLGHSSFKITGKSSSGEEVSVVTDPFDKKEVGLPYSKQKADIVTLSHHHNDHNALANIDGEASENYFLIDTPGEYEVKGLRIIGVHSYHDEKQGKERGNNTIYVYDFQEARIAHLGDLGHTLEAAQTEMLENIDIVITPVGGVFTVDPKNAMQVIESIEPLVAVPMHYKTDKHSTAYKDLSTLEDFLKEAGSQAEAQDEIKIKSHTELPQNFSIVPLRS